MIRLRLQLGRFALPAQPTGFAPADYAQHLMTLKDKLAKGTFSVVLEPPFVVIGDEPVATVTRRAKQTVRFAVSRLKTQYFSKDPTEILDIWLFQGDASYRANAKALFGDIPDTPYGYYSHTQKALVMNIATGGGTLVHEIVHPFIATNFPECPTLFNEGLASLYEQSGDADGRIIGHTNWRLKGLQEAIRSKGLASFEDLCKTSQTQFYREDKGANYAQARYLCYYLQEKGLLGTYYRAFVQAAKDDPAGYRTLCEVLGKPDMAEWQKGWEEWVLGLKYAER